MALPCDPYSFGGADGGQPSHFFTRYFLLDTLFGGRCLAPAPSPRALVRDSRLGGPSGRFLSLCEPKQCQPIKVLETYIFIYGRPLVSTMAQMNTHLEAENGWLTVVRISNASNAVYRVAYNPPYEPAFDVVFFDNKPEAMAHFNKLVAEEYEDE